MWEDLLFRFIRKNSVQDLGTKLSQIFQWFVSPFLEYHKVTSSRLSQLAAHARIFRLFMKGKFDAFGQKSSKLNSRPVYCLRLYSIYEVWNFLQNSVTGHCRLCPEILLNCRGIIVLSCVTNDSRKKVLVPFCHEKRCMRRLSSNGFIWQVTISFFLSNLSLSKVLFDTKWFIYFEVYKREIDLLIDKKLAKCVNSLELFDILCQARIPMVFLFFEML